MNILEIVEHFGINEHFGNVLYVNIIPINEVEDVKICQQIKRSQ